MFKNGIHKERWFFVINLLAACSSAFFVIKIDLLKYIHPLVIPAISIFGAFAVIYQVYDNNNDKLETFSFAFPVASLMLGIIGIPGIVAALAMTMFRVMQYLPEAKILGKETQERLDRQQHNVQLLMEHNFPNGFSTLDSHMEEDVNDDTEEG